MIDLVRINRIIHLCVRTIRYKYIHSSVPLKKPYPKVIKTLIAFPYCSKSIRWKGNQRLLL